MSKILFNSFINMRISKIFPLIQRAFEKLSVYDLININLRFGEGNGTPLQYSCLENPREPGGLQATGSLRVGHD